MTITAADNHLAACWQHQDCRSCLHEAQGCGWCATGAVCVPAASLLEPVVNHQVCPHPSERFELRTRALGCDCSTTTFLSVVVTVFATLAASLLLYAIYRALKYLNPFLGTGSQAGWQLIVHEDGTRTERSWYRRLGWKAKIARGLGMRKHAE